MKKSIGIFLALSGTVSLYSYVSHRGYPDSQSHIYRFTPQSPLNDQDDKIQAVTYNVQFCSNIDRVVDDLNKLKKIQKADVLLLQEVVSELGGAHCVLELAKDLNFYAVFAPAMQHPKNK